jgi:predicted acetyltransferase
MSRQVRLEGMNAEPDLQPVTRLLLHAFAGTAEGIAEWLKNAGYEHMRVVRGAGGAPEACLLRIPMGQYFGGRAVPMLGIAGVGTAPEARGQGLARSMMREAMVEAARDGFPLSGLYPSTQALYRQAGFEQSGHRLLVHLPLASIDTRDRAGAVEHLTDADDDAVKAAYARFAAGFEGMLDRSQYIWNRIKKAPEDVYHGFGIRGPGGALEGYLYLNQKRRPDASARQEINLSDFVFLTPGAGRRLLAFLADFGTMGELAIFAAGPSHPALTLLGQQRYSLHFHYYWMTRVLSVEKALGARGYAPGIDAEVHLQIEDDLIPGNHGPFTLRVRDGAAEVSRGGRGEVRTGIRGLAAMYTAYLSPSALALAGLVTGPERALRAAGAVFGGSAPWMTDFF